MNCLFLALVVAAVAPAPASLEPLPRLLVLPLDARPGVSPKQVEVLTDYLFGEARRVPGYAVISQQDIQQMLSLEMRRQLVGCDDKSCLAELGDALNAQEVLYGSVGALGERDLVVALTRVKPRSAEALDGGAERLGSANPEAMVDSIGRLLHRLYPGYTPPPPRVGTVNPVLLGGLLSVVGAAMQYSTFGSLFTAWTLAPSGPFLLAAMTVSLGLCGGTPLWGSWLQAWLADLVARRQVALWKPVVAGLVTLAGVAVLIPIPISVQLFLLGAQAAVFLLPTPGGGRPDPVAGATALVGGVVGVLAGGMALLMPLVVALVVAPPVVQTLVILWQSKLRSPDEDARLPTLLGPDDPVPAAVGKVVPGWFLGGKPAVSPPPEEARAPAPEPPPDPPAAEPVQKPAPAKKGPHGKR